MDSEVLNSINAGVKSIPFISPSSPPPILENLPSDEEEFGSFSENQEEFDITGLSQKLPKCPSPSKDNNISPPSIISNSITEIKTCLVDDDCTKEERGAGKVHDPGCNNNFIIGNDPGVTSEASSSVITPPPLDCVLSSSLETLDNVPMPLDTDCNDVATLYYEKNSLPMFEKLDLIDDCESEKQNTTKPIDESQCLGKLDSEDQNLHLPIQANTAVNDDEFGDFIESHSDKINIEHNNENVKVLLEEEMTETDLVSSEPIIKDNKLVTPEISTISTQSDDNSDSSKDKEEYLKKIITCHQSLQESFADDDSDFGDFADFESANVVHPAILDLNDDFADASEEENSELENEIRNKIDMAINDDDDFGDFTSTSDFKAPELSKPIETEDDFAAFETAFSTSKKESFAGPTDKYQFDSLILRWVPFEPCFVEDEGEEKNVVQPLEEVIEGDAFIWHHLQDIDSSLALKFSWAATQTNKLFSTALNVDARNIVSKESVLMGNQWSSSVPVFAQTLSFSPLTPVKPASDSDSVKPWTQTAPKVKELPVKPAELPVLPISTPKETEKVIPPVTFDWSSSGLTNPLDGPGCVSSLLDYQSLMTGSKASSGATCSALSSLEKEILSSGSGHSRSSSGPVPTPLIKKILEAKGVSDQHTTETSVGTLPNRVRNIVTALPNLNFMRSKVLMFPIRDDKNT